MINDDPRENAIIALLATAVLNTAVTWNHLPHFPMELSQMGWGKPGEAGGYHILQLGLSVAGGIMFRYHVQERSALGAVGAVFMVLLGLINGNDVPLLETVHTAVALVCFLIYIAYILYNGGSTYWIILAIFALGFGHAIIFSQLDVRAMLNGSLWDIPSLLRAARNKEPLWVRRLKGGMQYTMIFAFCVSIFQVPLKVKQP